MEKHFSAISDINDNNFADKKYAAISEVAQTFFKFGTGVEENEYVKEYAEFVFKVYGSSDIAAEQIINDALSVWCKLYTVLDLAAADMTQNESVIYYTDIKKPFIKQTVAKPMIRDSYMYSVTESKRIGDLQAIKYSSFLEYKSGNSEAAINGFSSAAIWGDIFAMHACVMLADKRDKPLWEQLIALMEHKKVKDMQANKIYQLINSLPLLGFKNDIIVSDAVEVILSDKTIGEIKEVLRLRLFGETEISIKQMGFGY